MITIPVWAFVVLLVGAFGLGWNAAWWSAVYQNSRTIRRNSDQIRRNAETARRAVEARLEAGVVDPEPPAETVH